MSAYIPPECATELRQTMCPETYRRVLEILDRWTATCAVPVVVSGLELLQSRSEALEDIRRQREEVARRTLANMIANDTTQNVLRRIEPLPSFHQDADVGMFQATLFRWEPR